MLVAPTYASMSHGWSGSSTCSSYDGSSPLVVVVAAIGGSRREVDSKIIFI
jgi:hypothetical protein